MKSIWIAILFYDSLKIYVLKITPLRCVETETNLRALFSKHKFSYSHKTKWLFISFSFVTNKQIKNSCVDFVHVLKFSRFIAQPCTMKIICILLPVTRGKRIVTAKLIGDFGFVTCRLRSRCKEMYWSFGPCYMKMEVRIQLNLLAFWSLLPEGWGIDATNPIGILGPLHVDGVASATKYIEVLGPVAWEFEDWYNQIFRSVEPWYLRSETQM